jgi:hypothetical protein
MNSSSLDKRRLGLLIATPAAIAIAITFAACSQNTAPAQPTKEAPAPAAPATAAKAATPVVTFNSDGKLVRPIGYRKWTYVGTPVTPNDMNEGNAPFPEFHNVYMNPAAFDHHEKTGEYPDQTVLVKELVSVGDKEATSGKGYFMGEFIGLEVSIKDKTRFADEPGNWAYFSFGHSYPLKEMAKMQPASSCNDCHDGNADDDWVFTQYYPVLRAEKDADGE